MPADGADAPGWALKDKQYARTELVKQLHVFDVSGVFRHCVYKTGYCRAST